MFPLRDNIPSQRFPVVTLSLIALNVKRFYRRRYEDEDMPW